MKLPFPITEVEDGIILYYFTPTKGILNKVDYKFVLENDKIYCVFNDTWAFPVEEILQKFDIKRQKYLYFMSYGFESLYSSLFLTFEMDEDFIVNYKAFQSFLKYKESLEKETASSTKEEAVEVNEEIKN